MIRLLMSLFFAPFWVHFLLAGGIAGLGAYVTFAETESRAEIARMANEAAPEAVPIEAFSSDKRFYLPVEVNVSAQIAMDHKVRLVETTNGKTTSERLMFILLAPDASAEARTAQGAVILHPDELEAFAAWATLKTLMGGREGAQGPVMQLDGMVDSPSDKSHIKTALKNQGYTAAKDFLYIAPFLEGRAAAFAKELEGEPLTLAPFLKFASVFVLAGVLRLLFRLLMGGKTRAVVAKANPTPMPPAPNASQMPVVDLPKPPMGAAARDNDFIGALARKKQAELASPDLPPAAKAPPVIVSSKSLSEKLGGTLGSGMGGFARKAGGFAAAIVLYLFIMNFSGSFGLPGAVSLMGDRLPQPEAPVAVANAPDASAVMKAAPVVQTPDPAAEPAAPIQAQAASPAPQSTLAFLADRFAHSWGKLKAQFLLWQAAPPLWLIATILGALIFVPALILLQSMMRTGSRQKDTKIDPFERLLQRRLAEQARMDRGAVGG